MPPTFPWVHQREGTAPMPLNYPMRRCDAPLRRAALYRAVPSRQPALPCNFLFCVRRCAASPLLHAPAGTTMSLSSPLVCRRAGAASTPFNSSMSRCATPHRSSQPARPRNSLLPSVRRLVALRCAEHVSWRRAYATHIFFVAPLGRVVPSSHLARPHSLPSPARAPLRHAVPY